MRFELGWTRWDEQLFPVATIYRFWLQDDSHREADDAYVQPIRSDRASVYCSMEIEGLFSWRYISVVGPRARPSCEVNARKYKFPGLTYDHHVLSHKPSGIEILMFLV